MRFEPISRQGAFAALHPVLAGHRPSPRGGLFFLTEDEADFIDAAMARFFPGGVEAPAGSCHVDLKLHKALHPEEGLGELQGVTASLYRSTIASTQAYCLQVYDRRFQDLLAREQDRVLALLEEGVQCKAGQMQILFEMLLNDSTEVFLTRALCRFQE